MNSTQSAPLGTLLQLAKRGFGVEDEAAFGFLLTNETHFLVPYRQAILWKYQPEGNGKIITLSGLAKPDLRTPYMESMVKMLNHWQAQGVTAKLQLVSQEMKVGLESTEWERWLPEHGVWAPLYGADNRLLGGLLLARETPWLDPEITLLTELAIFYGHGWDSINKHKKQVTSWFFLPRISKLALGRWAMLLVIIAAMSLPVRLSVLTPATVVARDPARIAAPINGTIENLHVRPNQMVGKGDLIFTLDSTEVRNKLIVAQKALAVLRAEYRLILQQNLLDQSGQAQKHLLEKRMEQQVAEINYVKEQLTRYQKVAPHTGIVLFDDFHKLHNKPVNTGDHILDIARPGEVELDLRLAMGDAIELQTGAETILFPNIDPMQKIPARLVDIDYNPSEGVGGVMNYRLIARFADGEERLKIGMHGTAKVIGKEVTLFYYIFRRPMTALRQWLGL